MSELKCYVCNRSESNPSNDVELRPYGANGQPICFQCVSNDPQLMAEAQRQFKLRLEAAGPIAVLDGSYGGVRPATYIEAVAATDAIESGISPIVLTNESN